jgi:uncharacterized protein (TIGR02646 family)
MIRIERGPEPATLSPVRAAELLRVRPLAAAGTLDSDTIGNAYSVVRRDLWLQQQMKCCYCEHEEQCGYNDVEHFRPKAKTDRRNGTIESGYWWLAWTWENLLFSCPGCNRSGKRFAFPLEDGSVPLTPENPPPGQERATLIDPCSEDPIELIQFVLLGNHWRPRGRNGSIRGQRTIEILELDRAELLDRYAAYVNTHVKPHTDAALEAIEHGDEPSVRRAWHHVRRLLLPRMPFVALSFDAIDHYVPAGDRVQWGLELPRPPIRGPQGS